MNDFIILTHKSIQYINQMWGKQKTIANKILMLLSVGKVYLKEMIKAYSRLFLLCDKNYRDSKKKYDNYNQLKKDLHRALQLLQYIERKMEKANVNRKMRRQFWNDFYSRGELRKEVFNELLKELQ